MTQSAMRMNMAGSRPNQQDAQKRSDQQSSQKRSNQQSSTARSANTPSDVIANAASQTKDEKRGVFASMKQAMAPYVEGHSHTVLYGIVGFVIARSSCLQASGRPCCWCCSPPSAWPSGATATVTRRHALP